MRLTKIERKPMVYNLTEAMNEINRLNTQWYDEELYILIHIIV